MLLLTGIVLILSHSHPALAARKHHRARRGGSGPAKTVPITSPDQIKAYEGILVDADTGAVLWERNADVPRPPASTTKIMTATLLLEHLAPDEVITASKKASETAGSSLHLAAGEQITARDMLYALMLRSANDGCVAVAEKVAGSEERFAAMMNEKAKAIGATHTHFANCNGLNCEEHVTTARDLALMARYASRYPEFRAATRTKTYVVHRSSSSKDTLMKNHAKFLWRFPGADGVKTGWTVPAGKCFVGGATWKGWRLISVVMHSPDIFGETAVLLKYGFTHFEHVEAARAGNPYGNVSVEGGQTDSVPAVLKDPLYVVRPRGSGAAVQLRPKLDTVKAPITAGSKVGVVDAFLDGRQVAEGTLVAAAPVARVAAVAVPRGERPWYFGFAALVGVIGIGYGSSVAKAARIRRGRVKAIMRGADHRG